MISYEKEISFDHVRNQRAMKRNDRVTSVTVRAIKQKLCRVSVACIIETQSEYRDRARRRRGTKKNERGKFCERPPLLRRADLKRRMFVLVYL